MIPEAEEVYAKIVNTVFEDGFAKVPVAKFDSFMALEKAELLRQLRQTEVRNVTDDFDGTHYVFRPTTEGANSWKSLQNILQLTAFGSGCVIHRQLFEKLLPIHEDFLLRKFPVLSGWQSRDCTVQAGLPCLSWTAWEMSHIPEDPDELRDIQLELNLVLVDLQALEKKTERLYAKLNRLITQRNGESPESLQCGKD